MKNLIGAFSLLILITAASCKKHHSSSSASTAASGSYVSSVSSYTAGTGSAGSRVVDSFAYDTTTHQVTTFIQYKYDTTSNTPTLDSTIYHFSFSGGSNLPATYTQTVLTLTGSTTSLHQLSYDGQNRITKDTSVSGDGFVTYYSYPTNGVVIDILFDGTPGPSNNEIDSFTVSGSNLSGLKAYYPNAELTADSLEGTLTFSYSGSANPFYHSGFSNTIGPLFVTLTTNGFGSEEDFISASETSSVTIYAYGLPSGITVPFTIATDSKGRVSTVSSSNVLYGTGIATYNYY